MRTGKNREFVIDNECLEKIEQKRQEGKGLVGGDIHKIPGSKVGLAPYLDFSPVPEILHFPSNAQEKNQQERFLEYRPIEIEIGFGGGNFLLERALQDPGTHFVGLEIRRHLCLSLANRIHRKGLTNIRVCYEDVRQCMPSLFREQSVQRCSVFFPDPWWKKKHLKRRLLTPSFYDLIATKLCVGGILHIKTDVLPYATFIQESLASDPRFQLKTSPILSEENAVPQTEREMFCQENKLPFCDLEYSFLGAR